jgi:23S rRNA (pseudouridine1915-N3)-methyltransferase
MHLRLITVSGRQPAWVQAGFEDYQKRLPFPLELVELPLPAQRQDLAKAKQEEAQKILKSAKDDYTVAFDERGQLHDTPAWSKKLQTWQEQRLRVSLLIGGPDGHDDSVLAHARERWSLSKLVLPHGLVRVVVAEQLYRAWSLSVGHPYHRA